MDRLTVRPAAPPRLLGYPGFRHLWLAQGISEAGDWLTNVALMLLVVRLIGHPGAAALVLLAKLLPRALVYPFGGLLADRFDRTQLMIGACLVRAVLVLSLLLARSPEHVWWVLLATGLSQVFASLFNPAAVAVVPSLVPAERLGPANALIGATRELAFLGGPLVGMIAIALGDVSLAFVLDAGTFLVAAVLLARIGTLARPAVRRPSQRVVEDLCVGWTTVTRHRTLGILFGAQVLVGTAIAALNALLVPLLVLHWQAPAGLLGLLYAGVGAGCLAGSYVVARLPAGSYVRVTLAAVALTGLALLGLGLAPWFAAGLGLLVLAGLSTLAGEIAARSHIQASVEDERLGRVFGLLFWVHALGQALGAMLAWLTSVASPALLVAGLGALLLAATAGLVYAGRPGATQPARRLAGLLSSSSS